MPGQEIAFRHRACRISHTTGRLGAVLALLALSGCGAGFVPSGGPRINGVMGGASLQTGDPGPAGHPKLSYAVVTLDPTNVAYLSSEQIGTGFSRNITSVPEATVRIGVGDIIAATIFEAQGGGLFLPADPAARQGNFVQLPAQQINRDGTFTVPFGGDIHAVGLTPAELERAIASRIAGRALEPQVIITVQDRRSNEVTVTGDVNASVRFGIDPGGSRLLGAIARAGGPRFPTYESVVTLQRGGTSEHALLADILDDPRQNIELEQNDSVIITHEPRYFLALGAVGQSASVGTQLNNRFPFADRHLSMADALARAGGLSDQQANPEAVFLFRFEHAAVLRKLGVNVPPGSPPEIPTVYRADFMNASSLFLANEFQMRPNDMIFVSDAPLTDYQKFLSIILPFAESGASFRAFNP
jgi:polysaccharide export outer membrane protein